MRKLFCVSALLLVLVGAGCTANQRARSFGGTMNLSLPPGEKLVHITWRNEDLWYATRAMRPGETAEVYHFQEDSTLGLVEGTVVITEHLAK